MAKTHINVRIDSGLASFMLDYKLKKAISTKSEVVERAFKTLRDIELKEAYKQAILYFSYANPNRALSSKHLDSLGGEQE